MTTPVPSRRRLLRRLALAPVAVAASALPALAATADEPGPLCALLAERNRLADWINDEPDWGEAREPEREAVHARVFEYETRVMRAPPSRDALIAQAGLGLRVDSEGARLSPESVVAMMRAVLIVLGAPAPDLWTAPVPPGFDAAAHVAEYRALGGTMEAVGSGSGWGVATVFPRNENHARADALEAVLAQSPGAQSAVAELLIAEAVARQPEATAAA